jgi:predicted ATP-grasp superfamily ATP-dependent carboligase
MKQDACSGRYLIIEPNIGRPTGRSATAEIGGVELLYTMYCDAVGWPLPANREQKYKGVKWIYLRQDFRSALYRWRKGELTLKEWRRSWHGLKTDAVFSWRDPVPFLSDIIHVVRVLLSDKERRKKYFATDSSSLD